MTGSSGGPKPRRRLSTETSKSSDPEYTPIEQYGVIGNLDTCAHVSRQGSIDWCCFPHVDSSSVFAAILDSDTGGHWSIRPTESFEATQQYVNETNVLRTTFTTEDGRATLTDFMPVVEHAYDDTISKRAIYRRISGEEGHVEIDVEFAPRPDYARTKPELDATSAADVVVDHESDQLVLDGIPSPTVIDGVARSSMPVEDGDTRWLVLEYGSTRPTGEIAYGRVLEETIRYWRDWVRTNAYRPGELFDGPWQDLVIRSSLVLKLLTYAETGTVCAAPTTSLPELIGGVRNWDYRYNWLRDAAFTVQALYKAGYEDEASAYTDWFVERCHEHSPENLKPMYGLRGDPVPDEQLLRHLSGYRDSHPVRVGNAAKKQLQLDIYGETIDALYEMSRHGRMISPQNWDVVREVVDHICDVWDEPDSGIWEVRSPPQQFVYSKVMCWVGLDRGIRIVENTSLSGPTSRWNEHRERIKNAVLKKGFNQSLESFVRSFEEDDLLDATGLLIPITGFLPFDDERVQRTIDTTLQRLVDENGLVHRYEGRDGLPGEEGAFLLCSFWLVDALALSGRTDEAVEILEDVAEYANPLGLFSEEVDPSTGAHLGNTPQAFSHIGLINSVLYLESMLSEEPPDPLPRGAEASNEIESGNGSDR